MLKKYDVTIYGRKNTIIGAIRNERLYHEVVLANNKKDAMAEALNNFGCFMSEVWNELITRRDIRIECEKDLLKTKKVLNIKGIDKSIKV